MWALAAVQWLHIAMAILWVGAAVALEVVVGPAVLCLPLASQQALGRRLGSRAVPFFTIAGSGTLLFGIVRGTVLGPLHRLDAFASAYGITWMVALTFTAALAAWGALLIGRGAERLYSDDSLWQPASGGQASRALRQSQRRLQTLGRLQLAGFALVLTCMILMTLGL
jgi:copper resistance protein D